MGWKNKIALYKMYLSFSVASLIAKFSHKVHYTCPDDFTSWRVSHHKLVISGATAFSSQAMALKETLNLAFHLSNHPFEE